MRKNEADWLPNFSALYILLNESKCNLSFCLSDNTWSQRRAYSQLLSRYSLLELQSSSSPSRQKQVEEVHPVHLNTTAELKFPDPAPYAEQQYFSTLKVSSKNESSRGWLISPVPNQKGWKWHFWWNTFFLLCQILQIFSLNHLWQLSSPWLSYSQHARTKPFTASSIQG